jgi:ribonucleoside-diphosphate reductase beta chain
MFEELIKAETVYAEACIKNIAGYSAEIHIAHAKYLANVRMQQIGMRPVFPEATSTLPWLSEMIELKKEKNFFEAHVTEYQTGSKLSFDDVVSVEDILAGWR